MTTDPTKVLTEVIELVEELAGDWEYDGDVGAETRFLADLELESLDLVVLGAELQERYGRLPMAEFLTEVGERPVDERDVTVKELADMIAAAVEFRAAEEAGA
jgi:acyl carrier protein